ncbi:MAG: alcohol dehydrogenase catalytic domain-containing protein [Planctomycetes bacterium]|nr:alcohol dehydrogenase catalytic domain-containing protein [Planctomycetota bacterium]
MSVAPTMKALVFEGPGRLQLRDVARPTPAEGEVLVHVHRATICGTDIRIVEGRKTRDIRYGYPIGHECAGTVAEVGPGVTGYAPGERVAVCVVVSCGECRDCRADRENLCAGRITLGYHTAGAFAEYMLIPAQAVRRGNLFKLPDEVGLEVAPLLEPMGCCVNGVHEMHPERARPPASGRPSDADAASRSLAILGAGPIGLLHLKIARAYRRHERIVMTEPLPHRREAALRFGADAALAPEAFEPAGTFDDVLVAFGDTSLVDVAMRAAGKCGRVSLFAGFDEEARVSFDPNLVHYQQLRLTGGSESRRRDYAEALALVRDGSLDLTGLVSHWFPLGTHEEAFRTATQRLGLKVGFQVAE